MYSPKLRESRPGGSCCRFLLRACERRRCGFGWGLKGTTWGFQTEAYLVRPAHAPQSSVAEMGRRRCDPVSGLLFTGSHTTLPCSLDWMRERRRDRGLRRKQLRRQKDLAAGGGQIGHPGPRLGLRWRRRFGVEHGVGEPVGEFLAAAIVLRSRRLRFAFRAVGRADEPNVEMKVVSPPRLHLAEP